MSVVELSVNGETTEVVVGSVTTGEDVVVGCTADTLNSVIINIQSINWTLCNVCPCEKQRVQKKKHGRRCSNQTTLTVTFFEGSKLSSKNQFSISSSV